MRTMVKQITAPIAVFERGEALAKRHTYGNFSALVRLLIEERVASDRLRDELAKAREASHGTQNQSSA